jgi:TonB family protein
MRKKIAALFSIAVLLLSFTAAAGAQTVKLRIVKKPHPKTARKCSSSEGTALVRVTFGAEGTVTDVELKQSSGCYIFDQSAQEAAWLIEFEPAMREGKAIAVAKTVEYRFFKV